MGVPDQIRKQTEKVQQLYTDLNSDEQPAAASGSGEETVHAGDPDGAAKAVTKPSTNEPADGGENPEDFAQKYRTLQGKYNAEVPTLTAQVRELTQRLDQTHQLLATMQQASPANSGQSAAPVVPKSLLTDQEREEYGESIDIMRKVSEEIVSPYRDEIGRLNSVIQQMQGQVMPRVEQLSRQQTQSAEQGFWASLTDMVPNWREVNDNPDFQTWLLETDPLTGTTRQSYLDDAQAKLDARRVASFFSAWGGTPGNTAQSNRASQTASELERQVAPGRGRTSSPPTGNQQKTYTQADVAKFYDDVRKGAYKGRDEDRARTERDIFAAQAEGRIHQA